MRRALIAAICAMLWSVSLASAGTGAIAPAAMAAWPIVCDARATEAERYAAIEFQTLYRGLTGRTLTIVTQAPRSGGAIYIGPGAVARTKRAMPLAKLGEEGLRIRVDRDALCIDGGRPRGTLYGVYEFFEELCGVRYLTYDHTYYPPNARMRRIPIGSRAYVPTFAFRWSYYGETGRRPEFAARLRTNTVTPDAKLGGITGYRLVMHNVSGLVPPAKYGREHPEYYALVKGKRDWEKTNGGGPQLCLTNPAVRDLVVQSVLDEIKANPTARNINIAQMDNGEYCTCPNCKALDAREGSHSGTMLAFVNAVAARVEMKHPDVLISTFAYWYTRKPPKTIRARRNVLVQLCSIECCDLHAIDDPNCTLNRAFCQDMAVWKKKVGTMLIWHYNTNFSAYMLPFPNLRAIGPSVKYFANNNGRGVFMQAAGNGFSTEMSDLRNYVMSRCLWKPGRDSWKEAMEFCRLHYRESAQPIIDYLTWYHRLVDKAEMHPTCFSTEPGLCVTGRTTPRMEGYFQAALARAKSKAVRERVEKASLFAYRAALGGPDWRYSYADGLFRSAPVSVEPNLLDTYKSLCAKYGVTMESEGTQLADYLKSAAANAAMPTQWEALALENDTWRVLVIPESNGKVVEMRYKPAGRDIAQPRRAFHRFRFEEWVADGEGPSPKHILPCEVVDSRPDAVSLAMTAADGTRFERTISLVGDAVRFETTITAAAARPLDVLVHPEYDLPTPSPDSRVLSAYVKHNGGWRWANRGWVTPDPTPAEEALIRGALSGGVIAFYNRRDGFGVEQRFDPREFREVSFRPWTSRQHVNLEMRPRATALAAGESTQYAYEVRYLSKPPAAR